MPYGSRPWTSIGAAFFAAMACACVPALNWRIVAVDERLQAQFPCKAERRERVVSVGAHGALPLVQWSCEASGATFALTRAGVKVPSDAKGVADDLLRHAAQNVGAPLPEQQAVTLATAVGGGPARRATIQAPSSSQTPRHIEVYSFEDRSTAYQLAIVAITPQPESTIQAFFEGVHWLR